MVEQRSGRAPDVAVISHWIDGTVTAGPSEQTLPAHNPATGQQTGQVTVADQADVDASVSSAKRAAQEWRRVSLSSRAAVLFAFRELLHARAAELAAVVTAEHGKVLSDAEGEIERGLGNGEFACGIPHLLKGGFSERASRGVDVHSIRQPLGVVAGSHPTSR
jgi:malonate-semialdehyde dehydrogenase (acetylating) / methylmalonate-semialdehyde dehydrogenase